MASLNKPRKCGNGVILTTVFHLNRFRRDRRDAVFPFRRTARMSAFDPKRTLSLDAPMSDWSCNPILAGKRSDLDALDDAALHRRVEILHRLLIKVDDAPWLERPNIIYFDDRSLVRRFDEREPRAIGLSWEDATKEPAQLRLNGRSPAVRAVGFARRC